MYKEHVDCVVIGAGVVGLAVAREMAMAGREVLVLESDENIGRGISSRNSEVIHAGIYYPQGSLKAKLCVSGKKMLYEYARSRNVPHKICKKLIVATDNSQIKALHNIRQKAENNGVDDLRLLSKHEVKSIEAELRCEAALLSPSTGIIDTHNYMLCLHADIENYGGEISFLSKLLSLKVVDNGIELYVSCNDGKLEEEEKKECSEADICLVAAMVINCAGLGAVNLARKIENYPQSAAPIPYQKYAKGNYFSLSAANPFSHLIYPVPEQGGLGVHLTMDLANRARFGPDVEWVDKIDYKVSSDRAGRFYKLIREYWPSLPDNSLLPDYSGIRPKICIGNDSSQAYMYNDFMIHGFEDNKIRGLVNLFGIESPGLTASLAIARYVKIMLLQ